MSAHLTKLIIGSAQFGMHYGIANQKGKVSKSELSKIFQFLAKTNITSLDTAKIYGQSEESIGEQILLYPNHKWNIITKVNQIEIPLINQVLDSKKKLSVFPQALLCHKAELYMDDNYQKQIEEIKKLGLVNQIGVSVYNSFEIKKILKAKIKPNIIQLPLNILDTRLYKNGWLYKCKSLGIEIHARSLFLQGLFFLKKNQISNSKFADVESSLHDLKIIAFENHMSLAQLALLWVINLREVDKVVLGIDCLSHLKMHYETIHKTLNKDLHNKIISINYVNEKILNPSLW